MPTKRYLAWGDVEAAAVMLLAEIQGYVDPSGLHLLHNKVCLVYGVPRGGVFAALVFKTAAEKRGWVVELASTPERADFILDDLIDSGATCERYRKLAPRKPFLSLFDKRTLPDPTTWLVFPWEQEEGDPTGGPEDAVLRLLQYIGEDPKRDGLLETPKRVIASYGELFGGYKQDPASVFKTFDNGADEMVVLKDIEFYSTCEHHMLPFIGKAHIAYLPVGKVIGVSKLARLLEIYSRRLQIQEQLTLQVTAALDKYLQPKGSACLIEAKHLCMTCRGVNKQNSVMLTSSLTGAFRQPEVRAEFFSMIGK
jgi:GTP cyclohydrolase I